MTEVYEDEHTMDCIFYGMTDSNDEPIPYGVPGCSCPGTAERAFLDSVAEGGSYGE